MGTSTPINPSSCLHTGTALATHNSRAGSAPVSALQTQPLVRTGRAAVVRAHAVSPHGLPVGLPRRRRAAALGRRAAAAPAPLPRVWVGVHGVPVGRVRRRPQPRRRGEPHVRAARWARGAPVLPPLQKRARIAAPPATRAVVPELLVAGAMQHAVSARVVRVWEGLPAGQVPAVHLRHGHHAARGLISGPCIAVLVVPGRILASVPVQHVRRLVQPPAAVRILARARARQHRRPIPVPWPRPKTWRAAAARPPLAQLACDAKVPGPRVKP